MLLSETEIRVLGVLMEKSLTQAGSYPLTLNAITLGANQLQNRDPVLNLNEHEVSAAIRTLQHKKLVAQAPPSAGARSNRFEHKVVEVMHWDRRDQAILAELMLRGRQTPGELRSRASRMTPFADVESVMVTLQGLRSRETPFVEELAREPGRSANRFRHLLSAEVEDIPQPAREKQGRSTPADSTDVESPAPSGESKIINTLTSRVEALESQIRSLARAVQELQAANPPGTERRPHDGP